MQIRTPESAQHNGEPPLTPDGDVDGPPERHVVCLTSLYRHCSGSDLLGLALAQLPGTGLAVLFLCRIRPVNLRGRRPMPSLRRRHPLLQVGIEGCCKLMILSAMVPDL
jgi:hypothetical protein